MSFFTEFNTALFAFTRDVTGLDNQHVISYQSDGTEPVGDYVSVDVVMPDQIGSHYTTTLARDSQLGITVIYDITVSFFFVGKNSASLITDFNSGLNNVYFLERLAANKVSVKSKGGAKDITVKRDTKWLPRYAIEVIFTVASHTSQTVDTIEKIEYSDLSGNVISIP